MRWKLSVPLALLATTIVIGCKDNPTGFGDREPPTTPTITSATAVSPTAIQLTWTEATDDLSEISHYTIYRDGVQIATSKTTAFEDRGLVTNQRYRYTVTATDACDNTSAEQSLPVLARAEINPPTVTSTTPRSNATGVPINTAVSATFSEEMRASTIDGSTFTLSGPSGSVSGTVAYSGFTATLRPAANLAPNTTYTATITTGARDLGGNALASNYVWRFTTGTSADNSAPAVILTNPRNGATGVVVNTAVSATFSEPMDPASISAGTFTLTGGGATVQGPVAYSGTTATLRPSANLAPNTTYTATITTGARDLAGNPLPANFTWTFTTGAGATDNIAPLVTSTSPANGAGGVPTNTAVGITFSEAMDPATLNTETVFATGPGGARVAGSVTFSGRTATFQPAAALAPNTAYTVTVSRGATDLAGNPLPGDYTFGFTTGGGADIAPPVVTATSPANGTTGVPTNATVNVTFSEPLDPATVNSGTFTVRSPAGNIAGTVSFDGTTATFTPSGALAPNTTYTVTLTTGIRDAAGNPLPGNHTFQFTTGAAADTTRPTIIATKPANGATGVPTNTAVSATFSEPMDPASVSTATFTVRNGGGNIAGTVSYNDNTGVFRPNSPLSPGTTYTATVTTGATDVAGNPLANNSSWTFTTGSATDNTAPFVTAVAPANGATGVPITTNVRFTFSEPVDPTTVNAGTVMLRAPDGTNVAGTVTYDAGSQSAVFTPSSPLAAGTQYTTTVTTGVRDLAGNALASPFTSTFTTAAPDNTAPVVTAVVPANGATGVPTTTTVRFTFSEPVDPATVNTGTVMLRTPSGANVAGTVTYDAGSRSAVFTPSSPLAAGTQYTTTVTTGVRDLAGNALASPFTSTFTTAAAADNTAPTVIGQTPPCGATGVSVNTKIAIRFSEPLKASTVNTSTVLVASASGAVAGTVSFNPVDNTVTFTPATALASATTYTVTVLTTVTDLAGNALVTAYVCSFTTATVGAAAPTVTATNPANGATGVPVNSVIKATFSEPIDPATINATTFLVAGAVGTVTYDAATRTATFTPTVALASNTNYAATLTTGIRDLEGNAMASNFIFSFTTASVTP